MCCFGNKQKSLSLDLLHSPPEVATEQSLVPQPFALLLDHKVTVLGDLWLYVSH